MAQTQLADVIVPAEFTTYQVENSMVSTALYSAHRPREPAMGQSYSEHL